MSLEVAEAVLRLAESDEGAWPLKREAGILTAINTWAALREGDPELLKTAANWRDTRRPYRVDPLAERIADAWAHFLFGEEPIVTPANEADIANLEGLITDNDLASELERAAGLCVSEGEIWARVYVDELVAPRPLLDWVSRRNVLPLWVGPRLAGAAIITELGPASPQTPRGTVYRHFEVHAPGVVLNALYVGKGDKLGTRRALDEHPDTAPLDGEGVLWQHGLPGMLVTRIPNRLRADRRIGVSDYAGIKDTLLDLNEAAAIGAHNMRLTARKRAVVPAAYVKTGADHIGDGAPEPESQLGADNRPRFDIGEEVFVEDPLDAELGKSSTPLRVLEYSFDASALIDWKRDLVETALTRVGLSPQYVGANAGSDGYAISGTALRLRLIPTDKTGRGKGRYWDDAIPRILQTMAALDSAPAAGSRGFGRQWTDAASPPTVERRPGLPEDTVEEAQRHQVLVGAGLESIETAVRDLHPDRDEDWIGEEVDRIREDRAASAPPTTLGGFGLA